MEREVGGGELGWMRWRAQCGCECVKSGYGLTRTLHAVGNRLPVLITTTHHNSQCWQSVHSDQCLPNPVIVFTRTSHAATSAFHPSFSSHTVLYPVLYMIVILRRTR
jgi:hypothetical protein